MRDERRDTNRSTLIALRSSLIPNIKIQFIWKSNICQIGNTNLLTFYYFCIMNKNDIIAEINLSLQHLNVSKVILFGSYAKGTMSDDSDIDLLVVTNDNFVFESFAQKMEIKLKIANALNPLRKYADIDLIVHTKPMYEKFIQLNSGFKKEILISGSVIYEANN